MGTIEDGPEYIDVLLSIHHPKVVLLGVDFWWFNESDRAVRLPIDMPNATRLSRKKILKPFVWLWEKTITVQDYLSLLVGRLDINSVTRYERLGVQAIKQSVGTRKDGSGLHGYWAFGFKQDDVVRMHRDRFKNPASILEYRSGKYAPDRVFSERKLDVLKSMLDRLSSADIEVVLLLLANSPAGTSRH